MNNSIRNKLKSDYEDLQDIPSQEIWNRLEQKLGQQKEKNTKKTQYIYIIAASLIVLFGLLIFWKVNEKAIVPETIYVKKNNDTNADEKLIKGNAIPTTEIVLHQTPKIANESENIPKQHQKFQVISQKKISSSKSNNLPIESLISTHTTIPDSHVEKMETDDNMKISTEYISEDNPKKNVSANDLIFQRELDKSQQERENLSIKRIGIFRIKKPKILEPTSITVFEKKVYETP